MKTLATRTVLFLALFVGQRLANGATLRHFDVISAESLEGKPVTIDFGKATKGTVLAFLSINCPCSRSHEAKLKDLAETFSDYSFYAVFSNQEESKAECQGYWKNRSHGFRAILRDPQQALANRFGALKTPHIFVIDREGNEQYRGAVDNSRMANQATRDFLKIALSELRKGKKLSQVESRPLGCAIGR